MNEQLTEQIARHILASLGVLPVSFIDYDTSRSLNTKDFLLQQRLLFKNEKQQVVKNAIYGCQMIVGQKQFKIVLGDCSQEEGVPEFCLIAQLTGLPAYGLYMICDPSLDSEAIIAASVNDKDWMPCSTFLQATFLAAMEQLKDTGLGWVKCTDYQKHYQMLLSLIQFHTAYYEVKNEGQEI
jgi:hypothetical protein